MKNLFCLLGMMLISTIMWGQRTTVNPDQKIINSEELNLTEDQKSELKEIFDKHKSTLKTIRDSEGSREERAAGMKALKTEMRGNVAEVLSEEQLEIWDKLQAEREADRLRRRGEHKAAMEELNLSVEQIEELNALKKTHAQNLKNIQQDDSTDESKKEALAEERTSFKESVRELLDEEQFAAWEKLQKKPSQRKRGRS